MNSYILPNKYQDNFFILYPGILIIIFSLITIQNNFIILVASFIIFYVLDAGHVYTTFVRTLFPKQINLKERVLYFLIPICVLIIIFLWLYFKIPYFWSLLIYLAFFHFVRQQYGIIRWYEKKEHCSDKRTKYFTYGSMLIPFLIMHFRDIEFFLSLYVENEFFIYPSAQLLHIGYIAGVIFGLSLIIYCLKNKTLGRNTKIALITTFVIYGYCFVFTDSIIAMAAPLKGQHAIQYLAIMALSTKKLHNKSVKTVKIAAIIMISIAVFFGLFELLLEYVAIDQNYSYISNSSLSFIFFLVLLTFPSVYHYIIDGFIWTKKHSESKDIYQ